MPPFWDYKNRFVYGSKTEVCTKIDEIDHPSIRETLRYMDMGYGIDLHYNTDIPARSGIGSSSSFTVGLLNALYGMKGRMASKEHLAKEAIHIEQQCIKEAVGSQDQTAAAYGGLNYMIFRTDGEIEVHPLTISQKRMELLNRHLCLVFTGFQRFAKDIEKEKIERINTNTDRLNKIKGYVRQAVSILNGSTDICEFGGLLNDMWNEKKMLSAAVSDERVDVLYRLGIENGAIGGKLLGAGGGGFMLFFVPPEKKKKFIKALKGYVHVPFQFDNTGSQVIYYKPEV